MLSLPLNSGRRRAGVARSPCALDDILTIRGLTLVDLADQVGVTVANLSVLKNGHARAIRFSTLTAICDALDCTPGDLLKIYD